jgi:hypothetical protein
MLVEVPTLVPFRRMLYPATPALEVDAVQLNVTLV